jgi:hypothetical protein
MPTKPPNRVGGLEIPLRKRETYFTLSIEIAPSNPPLPKGSESDFGRGILH